MEFHGISIDTTYEILLLLPYFLRLQILKYCRDEVRTFYFGQYNNIFLPNNAQFAFLDASSHPYKRQFPSVGSSVHPLVMLMSYFTDSEWNKQWRKKQRGGMNNEEEGATRRKQGRGGRSDEEEGAMRMRERWGGSSDEEEGTMTKNEKIWKRNEKWESCLRTHRWPPRYCLFF